MCTDVYKSLCISHSLFPLSLVGEVRSVLANPGHGDLRPHPGHSAGHSGAGYLLCQDIRSVQGSMTCAVECNEAVCLLIC